MDIDAIVRITSPQTSTSTTLANATDMLFSVLNGVQYAFEFHLLFQSTATGTGFKVGVTGPTNNVLTYNAKLLIAGDGTAASFQGHGSQSGDAITATAVDAANTNYVCIIRGVVLPTADGTLQLQIASETGTQVQLSAGSIGLLYKPSIFNTGDQSSTTTVLANVTGLTLPVQNGPLYRFRFYIPYQSTDGNVGLAIAVTAPSSTFISYRGEIARSNDGTAGLFEGIGLSSGDQITADFTPVANENYLAMIDGIVRPSSDGNLQLQFASETGTQVTIKQGAVGMLTLLDELPLLPNGAWRPVLY